jgi:hypothetical protein
MGGSYGGTYWVVLLIGVAIVIAETGHQPVGVRGRAAWARGRPRPSSPPPLTFARGRSAVRSRPRAKPCEPQ